MRLLYASHPIGVVFEGDRLAGAVVGNKSSRQVILSRAVVDCTDWGVYARLAGAPFVRRRRLRRHRRRPPCGARSSSRAWGRRRARPRAGARSPCPSASACWTTRAHAPGYLGPAHVLVECPLRLTLEPADARPDGARDRGAPAHDGPGRPSGRRGARVPRRLPGAHLLGAVAPSPWRLEPPAGRAVGPGPPASSCSAARPRPRRAPEDMLDRHDRRAGEALAPPVLAPSPAPHRRPRAAPPVRRAGAGAPASPHRSALGGPRQQGCSAGASTRASWRPDTPYRSWPT